MKKPVCIWYTNFRSMIQAYTGRPSLETKRGKIDEREYRRLIEVLNFDDFVKSHVIVHSVMLNLFQHLIKSMRYETLK